MTAALCHYCGNPETVDREMRPYGPGGSWVCYPCATTPENERAAQRAFGALLEANGAISPVVQIGTREGPIPFDPASPPSEGSEP